MPDIMHKLRNPKHEEYAQQLALGKRQVTAYELAGYKKDAGGASRLANSPKIKRRVEQIHLEKHVVAEYGDPNGIIGEDINTLSDIGVNIWWVAAKYKEVFELAMERRNLGSALAAVQSMEKMVQREQAAGDMGLNGPSPRNDDQEKVSLEGITKLLKEVRLGREQAEAETDPAEDAKDITKPEPAPQPPEIALEDLKPMMVADMPEWRKE